MTPQGVPEYSPGALSARDVFFEGSNDLNIYVEDEEQENLYYRILRLLAPRVRVSQIFPLGGKDNVIKHALDPANKPSAKKNFYIVDKDFDDLLGRVVRRPNIFYLPEFCIENFLLEPEAIIEVAVEIHPKKNRSDLQASIGCARYFADLYAALDRLFRLFYVVQKSDLGLPNTGHPSDAFAMKGRLSQVDPKKIDAYEDDVRRAGVSCGKFTTEELDRLIASAIPKRTPKRTNISGKFVLGLLMHHLRASAKVGNISHDQLRIRLAGHCRFTRLRALRRAIGRRLQAQRRRPRRR
jgi:hypothetical protein